MINLDHPQIDCFFNTDLSNYTTFKLKNFGNLFIVKSLEGLKYFLKYFRENNLNYRVLGSGANLVIKTEGLNLLKLSFDFDESVFQSPKEEYCLPASLNLSKVISHGSKFNLDGFELITGIPATLGGAVFMNAGTSLGEIKDIVSKVSVISKTGEEKIIEMNKNSFTYRKNKFLNEGDIITYVWLRPKGMKSGIKEVITNYLKKRNKSQPMKEKTCGCVFKNPEGASASFLIDKVGLKGLTVGGISVSHLHANFFINSGKGTPKEFFQLVNLIQDEVYLQTGTKLEREVICF